MSNTWIMKKPARRLTRFLEQLKADCKIIIQHTLKGTDPKVVDLPQFWGFCRLERRLRFVALATSALTVVFTTLVHAQTSQFLFDQNGNLTVEMGETIFPPQITGQPQMQAVATNEFAAFSVVVADPRSLSYQWQFN